MARILLVDDHVAFRQTFALVLERETAHPVMRQLVLTASLGTLQIASGAEAGAAGILHKSTSVDEILTGVKRMAAGEGLLSASEVANLPRAANEKRAIQRHAYERLARRLQAFVFMMRYG